MASLRSQVASTPSGRGLIKLPASPGIIWEVCPWGDVTGSSEESQEGSLSVWGEGKVTWLVPSEKGRAGDRAWSSPVTVPLHNEYYKIPYRRMQWAPILLLDQQSIGSKSQAATARCQQRTWLPSQHWGRVGGIQLAGGMSHSFWALWQDLSRVGYVINDISMTYQWHISSM